jgi:hypothetical protein
MAGRRRLTASERQEIADRRRAQNAQSMVRIEVDEWTDDAGDPIVREVRISEAEVRPPTLRSLKRRRMFLIDAEDDRLLEAVAAFLQELGDLRTPPGCCDSSGEFIISIGESSTAPGYS